MKKRKCVSYSDLHEATSRKLNANTVRRMLIVSSDITWHSGFLWPCLIMHARWRLRHVNISKLLPFHVLLAAVYELLVSQSALVGLLHSRLTGVVTMFTVQKSINIVNPGPMRICWQEQINNKKLFAERGNSIIRGPLIILNQNYLFLFVLTPNCQHLLSTWLCLMRNSVPIF